MLWFYYDPDQVAAWFVTEAQAPKYINIGRQWLAAPRKS